MSMTVTTRNSDPQARFRARLLAWNADKACRGKTPTQRFWENVCKTDKGCWEWMGRLRRQNYGVFYIGGSDVYAHRFSYEIHIGMIPEGLCLDHLCRNPSCVNPNHLEAVTHRENLLRGDHYTNNFSRLKTHCKYGHEFTPANIYVIPSTGSRHCRTCRKAWHLVAYAKEKNNR